MNADTRLATLARAARALNAARVSWAVGASALLYLRGVTDTFHDFDLQLAQGEAQAADESLLSLGAQAAPPLPPSPAYATQHFAEYQLDGVDFDLLCGFAVRRGGMVYPCPFDSSGVAGTLSVLGTRVPLAALEDWFVIYLLMPGRAAKADLIARHLKAHPATAQRGRLSAWLNRRLPGEVRERVMALYRALP